MPLDSSQKAVKKYLSAGGKITKIKVSPDDIPRVFKDFRSSVEFPL
jgi:hypothetical protein